MLTSSCISNGIDIFHLLKVMTKNRNLRIFYCVIIFINIIFHKSEKKNIFFTVPICNQTFLYRIWFELIYIRGQLFYDCTERPLLPGNQFIIDVNASYILMGNRRKVELEKQAELKYSYIYQTSLKFKIPMKLASIAQYGILDEIN